MLRQGSLFKELNSFPGRQVGGNVELFIKVTPKASKDRIGEVVKDANGDSLLKIYVSAVPEDNKANKAVTQLLAKLLKIPASSLTITSGLTSRNKTVLIDGANLDEIAALIG